MQGKTDLLLATAQLCTPQEALKLGLLDEVVAAEKLPEAAESALQRFLRVDQFARAATKARQRQGLSQAWQVRWWCMCRRHCKAFSWRDVQSHVGTMVPACCHVR